MKCGKIFKGLPKILTSFFLFRIKLMAEGELKDMEQFFDDLSDSFFFWNRTRGSQNKCSRYEILLRRAENIFTEVNGCLSRHLLIPAVIGAQAVGMLDVLVCVHGLAILICV